MRSATVTVAMQVFLLIFYFMLQVCVLCNFIKEHKEDLHIAPEEDPTMSQKNWEVFPILVLIASYFLRIVSSAENK